MARKASAASAASDAPAVKPQHWTRDTLPRVILIMGEESALREEAIAHVRRAAFGGGDPGMSWIVLHGAAGGSESNALDMAAVLDEACTKSMFGGDDDLKVVLVRQADLFVAENHHALERNIESIPNSTTIVLEVANPGRLKTTNFCKSLAAAQALVACESLAGKYGEKPELEIEVSKRARVLGLQLAGDALRALMERSAQNLAVLEEELGKLRLALAPPGGGNPAENAPPPALIPVSAEDIAECCASTRTFNAFNFADALLDCDTKRSLELLGAIFDRGLADNNKPGKIITQEGAIAMILLGALTYKLNQLQDLQAVLSAGKNEFEMFGEAKIFGPRKNAASRALRHFKAKGLRGCMEALFRCNLNLRRGGVNPRVVLEQLIWDIVRAA
jgi:DNA polymerase III delta subunit